MSALQSNKSIFYQCYRFCIVAVILAVAMPVSAVIVVDSDGVSSQLGRHFAGRYPVEAGNANYMMLRSHAWRKYQRGEQRSGRLLVMAPYSGSLLAVPTQQKTVRNHIARAQAYRLGGRW